MEHKDEQSVRILLVDDDEIIRDSLSMFLEERNFQVDTCENAEKGIDCFHDHTFDIVIADFRLPGMNGVEFLQTVYQERPEVVTVLITAYIDEMTISKAMKNGIKNFIAKPFTGKSLRDTMAGILNNLKIKHSV